MLLRAYLDARQETNAAFARRANVAERTIDRVAEGKGCRLNVARLIVIATHEQPAPCGGVVTFEELVPSEESAA